MTRSDYDSYLVGRLLHRLGAQSGAPNTADLEEIEQLFAAIQHVDLTAEEDQLLATKAREVVGRCDSTDVEGA